MEINIALPENLPTKYYRILSLFYPDFRNVVQSSDATLTNKSSTLSLITKQINAAK